MKTSIIFLLIISSTNIFSGGSGGAGTGPVIPLSIMSNEMIKKIDNIELDNQIRYPKSSKEKIELLKRGDLQSIQMVDGTIVLNK